VQLLVAVVYTRWHVLETSGNWHRVSAVLLFHRKGQEVCQMHVGLLHEVR